MRITGFIVGATYASLAIGVALSQSTTRDEPVSTPLCELVKSPMQFHGKLVRVHADVAPPGIDSGLALYDRSCSAWVNVSPGNKLRPGMLYVNPFARERPPFRAEETTGPLTEVERYLKEGRPFEATIVGRFDLQLTL